MLPRNEVQPVTASGPTVKLMPSSSRAFTAICLQAAVVCALVASTGHAWARSSPPRYMADLTNFQLDQARDLRLGRALLNVDYPIGQCTISDTGIYCTAPDTTACCLGQTCTSFDVNTDTTCVSGSPACCTTGQTPTPTPNTTPTPTQASSTQTSSGLGIGAIIGIVVVVVVLLVFAAVLTCYCLRKRKSHQLSAHVSSPDPEYKNNEHPNIKADLHTPAPAKTGFSAGPDLVVADPYEGANGFHPR